MITLFFLVRRIKRNGFGYAFWIRECIEDASNIDVLTVRFPCLRSDPRRSAPPSSRPLLPRVVMVVRPVALDDARAEYLLHLVVRVQVARLDRQDAAYGDDGRARVDRHFGILKLVTQNISNAELSLREILQL